MINQQPRINLEEKQNDLGNSSVIECFLDSHLFKHKEYEEHKDKIQNLGREIFNVKQQKCRDLNTLQNLLSELEDYIEDNFSELKRQDRKMIIQGINEMQVSSPQRKLIEKIINGLINGQIKIPKLDEITSQILVEELSNNQDIQNNPQNGLQQLLLKICQNVQVWDQLEGQEQLSSIIKQLIGLYPYLKSWIFLRKPLSKFIPKIHVFQEHLLPFFQFITSQDLIILLNYILPTNEIKIIGECLANCYTPFPIAFKLEDNNQFELLADIGFYQLSHTQKSLVTYISLNSVKEEDSSTFCNKLLCLDQANSFETISKSLMSTQSVQIMTKIPHQFGSQFIFVKISSFNSTQLNENDNYSQIIDLIINQSKILIIHATKQEVKAFIMQQQVESLKILSTMAKKNSVKIIIIIIDGQLEESQLVYAQQNQESLIFLNSQIEILKLWECIQNESSQISKPFQMSQIVNSFQDKKEQLGLDYQEKRQNQVVLIEKILIGIDQCQNPVLTLNFLQKEIMDCMMNDVKYRINYQKYKIEQKQEQNIMNKSTFERQLKSSSIDDKVLSLFEFTLSNEQNDRQYVDWKKVFQLKKMIQQMRGKYQDQYEEQYIAIQSKAQRLEQQVSIKIESQITTEDFDAIQQIRRKIENYKEQIKKLDKDHQSKEITYDMIVNEINIGIGQTEQKLENQTQQTINNYFRQCYFESLPMQLIEGNTLQFGNIFLEQLSKDLGDDKLTIVSVVGLQSSAKSTLMNYVFQTDFSVGNGRVTKGLYFTRVMFGDKPMIVIDSEGLMSLIGRDQQYDNSIMAFIFLISDIVIFNQKGDANKQVKDLLELCGQIVCQMMHQRKLPSVIFALRDQNDVDSQKNIKQQTLQVVSSIQTNNANSTMKLDARNMILFPPAFNEQQSDGLCFCESNQIFSNQVLKLRKMIYQLSKENSYETFQNFYSYGEKTWKLLRGNCSDLIVASTLKAYQDKEQLQIQCGSEVTKYIKKMRQMALQYQSDINFNINSKDLDQEISQISSNFIQTLNFEIESSIKLLQKFVTNSARSYRLNDQKITNDLLETFQGEFSRERDVQQKKIEQMLEQRKTQIQIDKETESMDQIIIDSLKQIQQRRLSANDSVQQVRLRLYSLVEVGINKLTTYQNNLYRNLTIQTKQKWENTCKKLKDEKLFAQPLKRAYEFYYPNLQKRDFDIKELRKEGLKITSILKDNFNSELFGKNLQDLQNKVISELKNQLVVRVQQKQDDLTDFLKNTGQFAYSEIDKALSDQEINQNKARDNVTTCFIQNILVDLLQIELNTEQTILEKQLKDQKQSLNDNVLQQINRYKKMLQSAGDAQQQGVLYSKTLLHFVKQGFEINVKNQINRVVLELISNIESPEQENIKAFAKCYNGRVINPNSLIKYYLNTPKFIAESIRQDLRQLKAQKQYTLRKSLFQYFDQANLDIIQTLTSMLQITSKEATNFEQYFFNKLNKYSRNTTQLKASLYTFQLNSNDQEPLNLRLFIQGIIDGVKQDQQINQWVNQILERQFNQTMETEFNQEIQKAIGCNQLCPLCRAKCMLTFGHRGDHDPKQTHRFTAYAGVTNKITKVFTQLDCQDTIHHKWTEENKEYPNVHALLEDKYKDWVQHFKRLELESQSNFYDINFQKKAYVLIGDWFGNYYNQKCFEKKKVVIPDNWYQYLTLGEKRSRVPINMKFPGYE